MRVDYNFGYWKPNTLYSIPEGIQAQTRVYIVRDKTVPGGWLGDPLDSDQVCARPRD